jgi:hypothetical protein
MGSAFMTIHPPEFWYLIKCTIFKDVFHIPKRRGRRCCCG